MRILVTGFERFGPNDLNPTALLMDRLAGREDVIATVLPVEYHTSVKRFEALLDEHRPDAAVAFGLARAYDQIRLERVALNLDEAAAPDNAGVPRCVSDSPQLRMSAPLGCWNTRRPNSGRIASRWSKMSDWIASYCVHATVLVKQ